jgi:hypothetical protein
MVESISISPLLFPDLNRGVGAKLHMGGTVWRLSLIGPASGKPSRPRLISPDIEASRITSKPPPPHRARRSRGRGGRPLEAYIRSGAARPD